MSLTLRRDRFCKSRRNDCGRQHASNYYKAVHAWTGKTPDLWTVLHMSIYHTYAYGIQVVMTFFQGFLSLFFSRNKSAMVVPLLEKPLQDVREEYLMGVRRIDIE